MALSAVDWLLSAHADRQGVDISFTVFSFVCFLCVCTVTNFSAEDITGGVKFCTVVHRCPRRGISHFGEHCSPRSPKSEESVAWPALGSLGAGVRTGHA